MFLIVQNISFSLIAIDVCNPFSVAVNRFLYNLSFQEGLFIIFYYFSSLYYSLFVIYTLHFLGYVFVFSYYFPFQT